MSIFPKNNEGDGEEGMFRESTKAATRNTSQEGECTTPQEACPVQEDALRTALQVASRETSHMAAQEASHPVDHPAFNQFVATIAALRAPDGCPWDREQTHASIAHNMIEEAYEAVDAIESADVAHLREELGDVLLQVVLQSQIASDAGEFTIDDVCRDVDAKMVRRHPHVFGEATAANANEVLKLWDQVKLDERNGAAVAAAAAVGSKDAGAAAAKDAGTVDMEVGATAGNAFAVSDGAIANDSDVASGVGAGRGNGSASGRGRIGLLDGVPTGFPALMQAQKISRKAAAVGFEWDTLEDVWDKVHEEVAELREAYDAAPKTPDGKVIADVAQPELGSAAAVEMEFGDVLFALVNVARHMGVDAESALRAACTKFRKRWSFIECAAWAQGRAVEDLTQDEMEALWTAVKAADL